MFQLIKKTEEVESFREQVQMYDEVLHSVKSKMLAAGNALPSSLRVVLKELL